MTNIRLTQRLCVKNVITVNCLFFVADLFMLRPLYLSSGVWQSTRSKRCGSRVLFVVSTPSLPFYSLSDACLLGYHSSQLSGIARCSQALLCFPLSVHAASGWSSYKDMCCEEPEKRRDCVFGVYLKTDTMNVSLWLLVTLFLSMEM